MDAILVIVATFTVLSVISSPFIAISAHRRIRRLEISVAELRRPHAPVTPDIPTAKPIAPPSPTPDPVPETKTPPFQPESPASKNESVENIPEDNHRQPIATRPLRNNGMFSKSEDAGSSKDKQATAPDGERTFATKWLVWLGGVTITLGGIFLVKFSLDHGLIPPPVRICLGLLLSTVLIIGGERLRRRPIQRDLPHLKSNSVPQALSGSGISIAFGSIYAGYALFDMLSPGVAFLGLAAISIMALGLSLLQGPFVAGLGIAAAFAIPLLVQTETSSALGLFGYLSVIAAAGFAIFRYKDWWWLAGLTIACSVVWQFVGLMHFSAMADILMLTSHVILIFFMTVFTRFPVLTSVSRPALYPFDRTPLSKMHQLVLLSAVSVVAVTQLALLQAEYAPYILAVCGSIVILFEALSHRIRSLDTLPLLGAILALLSLGLWTTPNQSGFTGLNLLENASKQGLNGITYLSVFSNYGVACILVALWFGVASFLKIKGSKRPDIWAIVSGFAPIAVFGIAYLKMSSLLPDTFWTAAALTVAGAAIYAASRNEKHRKKPSMEQVLGLYALSAVSSIGIALTLQLETAWLTVSLSLMLATCAWAHDRFSIIYLRPAAALVAAGVLLRLVFMHQLPGASVDLNPDAITILYSYGLPTVFFAIAAKLFRRSSNDYLVSILESGVIAISITLVNLEIRQFVHPDTFSSGHLSLFELSLHSMTWLISAIGLYYRNMRRPSAVKMWGYRILFGLSAISVVGGQAVLLNPWVTGNFIGHLPVFNEMILAYILPTVAVSILAYLAHRKPDQILCTLSAGLAMSLAFLWLNLEVRNLFHDGNLKTGPMTDPELYAYSVAWLFFAVPILIVGLLKHFQMVRYAGLGLVLAVVAKVFIIDMAGLDGLYRAMSFLGLGFCLVAIGYVYQRYMKQEQDST